MSEININCFKKYLPILAGIVYSAIFGFSFLFTKNSLDYISPYQLLAYRFAVAAVFMSLLQVFKIININLKGKKIGLLLFLGLVQPIAYFSFETTGISYTTSAEAGLMISLIPVFVVILSSIILKEKPGKLQFLFVLLSVAGVIFITLMRGSIEIDNNYRGLLFLSGAVLAAALYNILSRKLSFSFNSYEITYIMMWTGAIFFNIIALIQQRGDLRLYIEPFANTQVLVAVVYLGIFSSLLAFFLLNYTIAKINAIKAAVFANMTTVIAIIAGIIFRNEPFYWFQIIGSIIIITGVFGTNYSGYKRTKEQKNK